MLRQLFAVILIALAVSPFTAPFSTCDLTAVDPLHQDSSSLSSTKVVDDVTAVPCSPAGSLLLKTAEQLSPSTLLRLVNIGEASPLVLRL